MKAKRGEKAGTAKMGAIFGSSREQGLRRGFSRIQARRLKEAVR